MPESATPKYGSGLRVACGVFGIFDHDDAAALTALGLHALQHRGQEAAGIVSFDGTHYHSERRMGLVGDHFTKQVVIDRLKGRYSIGHVRYSTTGDTIARNIQPLFSDLDVGGFALCHNGNLTNALTMRKQLIATTLATSPVFNSTSVPTGKRESTPSSAFTTSLSSRRWWALCSRVKTAS